MQENLRELVGHIQHTAQSVADSASELSGSAEDVNASTDEVERVDGEDRRAAPRRRPRW